jgi:threonine dehydrogenase-like Zn-dependent dehydrogenase
MKAVVFTDPHKFEVKSVPDPDIGADEILLRSKAVGICRSDFDLLAGEYTLPLHWPIIPGHEFSGEIVETGGRVKGYRRGERVVGECAVGCGSCQLCTSGFANCCSVGDHFGFTIDGAMAEYVKVQPSWLHKVPDNLSFKEAALIEPFTVGYYALSNIGGVDGGDTVLILGAGVIGLCVLIAAKGKGARVIHVDTKANRLKMAEKLGADHLLDTSKIDLVEGVMGLTSGKGADVVVEAVGVDPLMKALFDLVAYNGRVSITGISFNDSLPVALHKVQAKGLTVKGNIGSPLIWERAIRFLSQIRPDLEMLCTHVFALDDAVKAFETANDPSQSVKVQFAP